MLSHCFFPLRSNCDEKIGVILREHYQRPYFLPATAESKKTDWIFMGSNGYGAPMHVGFIQNYMSFIRNNNCMTNITTFFKKRKTMIQNYLSILNIQYISVKIY